MVSLQTLQAGLAGALDPTPARVLRINLTDQENLVAQAGQGFAEQSLGRPVTIHLRGVDQGHAEVDTRTKRGNLRLVLARVLAHAPGALTESGHLGVVRQGHSSHHGLLSLVIDRPHCRQGRLVD